MAVRLLDLGVDRELRVVLAEHAVAELDEVAMVGLRRPEHLGEDAHRQLGGDVGDEVDLPFFEGVCEHAVEELANALGEGAYRARGEIAVDDRAQLVVRRRVHVDHRLARLDLIGLEVLQRGAAALGGEGAPVLCDRGDVGVAGDRPEATAIGLLLPVDRILAAQGREHLVRHALGEASVVGEIDLGELHQRWCMYSARSQSET